jgi:Ca2+-binding EF-hand superfamily protein
MKELQYALMDLGHFPTEQETRIMHQNLGQSAMWRRSFREIDNGANIKEFIGMVEVLSFSELTDEQLQLLYQMFEKYSDSNNHLWREGLDGIMRELGHPVDEVELEMLMHEWDSQQRGYLVWDDFISIVAQVLKSEELVSKVEVDFLSMCENYSSQIGSTRKGLISADYHITPADLIRVSSKQKKPIDKEIAEEMIFDASETGIGMVSLNELVATLETVHRDESLSTCSNMPALFTVRELIPGFISYRDEYKDEFSEGDKNKELLPVII